MEGFIISILITLALVLLVFWNIDSKKLQRVTEEKATLKQECSQLARGVNLIVAERYKDFAVRWNLSDSWIEMAFTSFHLDQEDGFRNWTREEFLLWLQAKREEEGLFEDKSVTTINPRVGEMVERVIGSLPDLPR